VPIYRKDEEREAVLAYAKEILTRLYGEGGAEALAAVESGIGSRADVRSLRRHADAFLVGTSILKHPQPEQAVRRLVYGLTKICGLTGAADASAAWKAGATHGGLLFEPSSARAVSVEKAAEIRRAAPLTWVGVFVDDKTTRIAETARAVPLDAVQLHGRETRREIDRLRELLPLTCEIWKAIHVDDLPPEVAGSGADRLLFDRTVHGRSGGTGKTFDWSLLDGLPGKEDAILAGGLEPHNAARAAATGVAGLDTSTGVESSPGRKDAELLRCFMRARRRIEGRRKVNR